jgi:glucose-6-phosphate 1-dehydrogenase
VDVSQENPFQDSLRFERRVPPCAIVIFGANGDLTRRKLVPALYSLALERRLPPGFAVVGTSRTPLSDAQFRDKMRAALAEFVAGPLDEEVWKFFANALFYVAGDTGDPDLYRRIASKLAEIEPHFETAGNAIFYLSLQPSQYETAVAGLGAAGLAQGNGWRRLVIEKPFGHDLASARALDRGIARVFPESSVYRIDHYLGKETVQNIFAFRFANGIFEPIWNRRYVSQVQIAAAESIGVEGRGAYYEEAGALRDMIQNHLLQLMSTIAMEPPAVYEANAVRDERAKLLRSVRIMKPEDVENAAVAGQYGPARIGGAAVPGFREEPGVRPDSSTVTYAALTLFVDNWRWAGVPFYLRTGKRMPRQVTDIAIHFHAAPHEPFAGAVPGGSRVEADLLIVRIQPEEGLSLRFVSKQPGAGMRLRPVSMDFDYGASFGAREPSAYETLLLDAMLGDSTLYIRQDAVEASWAIVEPVLNAWADARPAFPNYAAGTWGPEASDAMLARRSHNWRNP